MKCKVCEQREALELKDHCAPCGPMWAARQTPGFSEVIEAEGWGRAKLPVALAANGFLRGVELGVQKGEHAHDLLRSGVKHLILVDLWARQENYFDIANVDDRQHQENFLQVTKLARDFPGRTNIIIGHSRQAAFAIPDESLDFMYADADHKYASVKADLLAWYPKVRQGGIIAGHDFMDSPNCCGSEFGVATAVKEFCASIGVKTVYVAQGECFPNWHFIKP